MQEAATEISATHLRAWPGEPPDGRHPGGEVVSASLGVLISLVVGVLEGGATGVNMKSVGGLGTLPQARAGGVATL